MGEKRYQVVQERYDDDGETIQDSYPIVFGTIDEMRAEVSKLGLFPSMFENEGHSHWIIELEYRRDRWHGEALYPTLRTFELT
jgi:hypothetical protein